MKIKNYVMLITAVLYVFVIVGCSANEAEQKLNFIENKGEQKLENAEKKVKDLVGPNGNTPVPNMPQITPEQAQATALAHAGFTAEQVTGLQTEYEVDDGIPQYDVTFYSARMEYDYEINAETGEIVSFDMDD